MLGGVKVNLKDDKRNNIRFTFTQNKNKLPLIIPFIQNFHFVWGNTMNAIHNKEKYYDHTQNIKVFSDLFIQLAQQLFQLQSFFQFVQSTNLTILSLF